MEFEISRPEWEMKRISIREYRTDSVMAGCRGGEVTLFEIMEIKKLSQGFIHSNTTKEVSMSTTDVNRSQ